MFKITLADGTELRDINLNITTLVSYTPIDPSIFENNLAPVTFEWEGEMTSPEIPFFVGEHRAMKFTNVGQIVEGEYWFVLSDVPEEELKYAQIRANIDYLAMMTDVEL